MAAMLNYKIEKFLITILFGVILSASTNIFAQTNTSIQNPTFKKVVDKYLDFDVDTISVSELKKLSGPHIILDAREIDEYNTSHIKGALHLGYNSIDKSILKNVEADTPIIIYCSIGYRSEQVGKKLFKMGFKNVKNLYGSIFEWANRGYDLYNKNELLTNDIHGYDKTWSKYIYNKELEITY